MKRLCSIILLVTIRTMVVAQQSEPAIDYHVADSVAMLYPGHSLSNLHMLAQKLTKDLSTDHEKFRAIFKWVCNNIDNDYDMYVYIKQKRQRIKDPQKLRAWIKSTNSRVVKKLIENHKTVCTGYAFLVKDMANHAGITCEIVDGYGRNSTNNVSKQSEPNHSWNAVKLDGTWYLCDPTWAAGASDPNTGFFFRMYDDSYFLTPPALFARKHFPLDTTWLLLDHRPQMDDFLNGPVTYAATIKYKVEPAVQNRLNISQKKGETITFRFDTIGEPQIKTASIRVSNHLPVEVKPYRDADNRYCLDYTFTAKGQHTTHILFNGQHTFTYVVTVK